MNGNVIASIILDLSRIPPSERERALKVLSPIILKRGNEFIAFSYFSDDEWRRKHNSIFEYLYHLKEKGKRTPFFCGCAFPQKRVEMSLAKMGSLYHFKTYKGQTNQHTSYCHFYDEPINTEELWGKWKKSPKL